MARQLASKAEGAAGGRKSIRVSSSSSSSAAPARVHLVVAAQPDERAGALWRGLACQPLRLGPLQHLPHHLHVLVRARLDVVVELHQDAVAAVCMHTQASTYDQLQLAVFFRKGERKDAILLAVAGRQAAHAFLRPPERWMPAMHGPWLPPAVHLSHCSQSQHEQRQQQPASMGVIRDRTGH